MVNYIIYINYNKIYSKKQHKNENIAIFMPTR